MKLAAPRQACLVAPLSEGLAEVFPAVWLAALGHQERQMVAGRRLDDGGERGMHRQDERNASLLLGDVKLAVANVLAAHADYVTAALHGIAAERKRQPRLGANGMVRLVLRNLIIS